MKVKLLFEFDENFRKILLHDSPFFNSATRPTKKNIAKAIETQLHMWMDDEGELSVTVIE